MKNLILGFSIFTMITTVSLSSVRGEFLTDRQSWSELNDISKGFYAMGFFDGAWGSDFEGHGVDVTRCIIEMNINAQSLVDLIDNGYRDASRWSLPPAVISATEVNKLCKHKIIQYRAER